MILQNTLQPIKVVHALRNGVVELREPCLVIGGWYKGWKEDCTWMVADYSNWV